jgi:hypothetical protein
MHPPRRYQAMDVDIVLPRRRRPPQLISGRTVSIRRVAGTCRAGGRREAGPTTIVGGGQCPFRCSRISAKVCDLLSRIDTGETASADSPFKIRSRDRMADVIEVRLSVSEPDADDELLRKLAGYLRDDLRESVADGTTQANHPSGATAAPDTRGMDLETVGTVLVTVQSSVEALSVIVSTAQSWLRRSPTPARRIRVQVGDRELELDAATPAQQQQIVDFFVSGRAADDNGEQA